ncbi:hypothetical protein CONPUDRAFT_166106 [Coniophora puteana RWD-64-598 SS2]|uniref:Uncharacterized protein n=1 Tax=Coniophora puteana (strain RWD-64-598) TaxID=741705 RepID=A0A5M3MPJ6_CONPW|nr:uncharacterized protein CONPUDRAFT_166106 [Coniophora puteana RWD-64-598 SS2]EIW80634.1 hypothetical protein CONPUDRAFT_166106 [Coniophora puteana RWD-64-598 SS2]
MHTQLPVHIPSEEPLTRSQLEALAYAQIQNQARSRNIAKRKRPKAELIEDILLADPPPHIAVNLNPNINASAGARSLHVVHSAHSFAASDRAHYDAERGTGSRQSTRPPEIQGAVEEEEDTPYMPPKAPGGRANRDPTPSPYEQYKQTYGHSPTCFRPPALPLPVLVSANPPPATVARSEPSHERASRRSSHARAPSSNGRAGSVSSGRAHASSSSQLRSHPHPHPRSHLRHSQSRPQFRSPSPPYHTRSHSPTPPPHQRILALHEANAVIHEALWKTHVLLEEQAARLDAISNGGGGGGSGVGNNGDSGGASGGGGGNGGNGGNGGSGSGWAAIGEMHELRLSSEMQLGAMSQRAVERQKDERWKRVPYDEMHAGDEGEGEEGDEEGEEGEEGEDDEEGDSEQGDGGGDQGDDDDNDGASGTKPHSQPTSNPRHPNPTTFAPPPQTHSIPPQENPSPELEYLDDAGTVLREFTPLLSARTVGPLQHQHQNRHCYIHAQPHAQQQPLGQSEDPYAGIPVGSVPWPVRNPTEEELDAAEDEDDDDDDDDDIFGGDDVFGGDDEDDDDVFGDGGEVVVPWRGDNPAFWESASGAGRVGKGAENDKSEDEDEKRDRSGNADAHARSHATGQDQVARPASTTASNQAQALNDSPMYEPLSPTPAQLAQAPDPQRPSPSFSPGADDGTFDFDDPFDGVDAFEGTPTPPAEAAAATAAALSAHSRTHADTDAGGGASASEAEVEDGLASSSPPLPAAAAHVAPPSASASTWSTPSSAHTYTAADWGREPRDAHAAVTNRALKRTRDSSEPEDGPSSAKRMRW